MGDAPNARAAEAVIPTEGAHEEATLAARAVAGDAEAFGALYDRYVDAVYRYVYYRVRNEAEAEDVTSEVFMKALRAMPRYQPRQPFLAWLYRIARNAVIDRARRARPQVGLDDVAARRDAIEVIDPDAGLAALADARTVRAAIGQLTPLQQEVIVLRYVEGLDTKSIGRLLGRRDGTIRGIEFRALGALRALIPSREAL